MNVIEKFTTRVSRYGIKYVIQVIIRNKLYRRIDSIVMSAVKMFTKKKALTNTIVIESHNDFDCNGGAFYNYLINNGYNKKYKIVWMLRNKKPEYLPENVIAFQIFKPSFRKAYYLCVAKYMTSDHSAMGRIRDGQIACYLDHGSIGLKAFKGQSKLPDELDCILAPSDFLIPILADQYNLPYPNSKQMILGYPMHDVFYDASKGDLYKITEKKYSKVILWMPTFRKAVAFERNDSNIDLPLGIPIFRDEKSCVILNEFLAKNDTLLVIKIHPMQDLTTVKVKGMSNIIVIDANAVKKLGVDNYRLMKDVDALISDYSSAAYDFLHRNKPIGFTLDDAMDYKLGFVFENPIEYMPGHIIYNQKDFIGFIEDVVNEKDPFEKKRNEISNLFFKYHDGNSSKRLVEYLGLSK